MPKSRFFLVFESNHKFHSSNSIPLFFAPFQMMRQMGGLGGMPGGMGGMPGGMGGMPGMPGGMPPGMMPGSGKMDRPSLDDLDAEEDSDDEELPDLE